MNSVSSLYNNVISHTPWIFGLVYKLGFLYDKLNLPSPVAYANSKYAKALAEYIVSNGFDAVISSHLFAMQAMVAVREKHGVKIPTYCIITDYTIIPFHKDTKSLDGQFAPTKETKAELIKKGFPAEKIYAMGIPVSPKFRVSVTMAEAKATLSIPEDKKVVMILSGGAGCGKMIKLCREMDKHLDSSHLVYVFPGKNVKLKQKLAKKFAGNPKIIPIDFTPDVNLYMKAAEVVLSKPGGLSSTEIAVANRPFVHLRAIPGCETYNIRYFTTAGLSLPGKNIKSVVRQTLKLLTDNEAVELMLKNQRENIKADAAELIVNKILEEIK